MTSEEMQALTLGEIVPYLAPEALVWVELAAVRYEAATLQAAMAAQPKPSQPNRAERRAKPAARTRARN